jgi:hypothetical protein
MEYVSKKVSGERFFVFEPMVYRSLGIPIRDDQRPILRRRAKGKVELGANEASKFGELAPRDHACPGFRSVVA